MNILLVEDDARIGRLISDGLRRRGCQVEWERVGKNVPELAVKGSFNTVIMDLLLPDSDGLELCRKIRAAEIGTPILVLTARADPGDRLDGFAAGVDDYVAKPFDTSELFARVRVLAKRDLMRKPDAANFERLRVDPNNYDATWRGEPVGTGRRTLLLLHALARARGEIVEREKLIAAVWGPYAVITDNALEGCVSTLRRQLTDVTDELTVEAVRGRGYALKIRGMDS